MQRAPENIVRQRSEILLGTREEHTCLTTRRFDGSARAQLAYNPVDFTVPGGSVPLVCMQLGSIEAGKQHLRVRLQLHKVEEGQRQRPLAQIAAGRLAQG